MPPSWMPACAGMTVLASMAVWLVRRLGLRRRPVRCGRGGIDLDPGHRAAGREVARTLEEGFAAPGAFLRPGISVPNGHTRKIADPDPDGAAKDNRHGKRRDRRPPRPGTIRLAIRFGHDKPLFRWVTFYARYCFNRLSPKEHRPLIFIRQRSPPAFPRPAAGASPGRSSPGRAGASSFRSFSASPEDPPASRRREVSPRPERVRR